MTRKLEASYYGSVGLMRRGENRGEGRIILNALYCGQHDHQIQRKPKKRMERLVYRMHMLSEMASLSDADLLMCFYIKLTTHARSLRVCIIPSAFFH